ncbi:MAG TPA: hypothetical protein VMI56_15780 [Reyranella sp.]|nr:hypothetical protein [Reyranella sp.]
MAAELYGPLSLFSVTRTIVWQLEFSIAKSRYDREVAQIPEGEGPRALLVKDRYRGGAPWAISELEETWFDESDQLGSTDASVRDRRFLQLHLDEGSCHLLAAGCHFPIVEARAVGSHYYLVVYRN